jgi:hypothetical protein
VAFVDVDVFVHAETLGELVGAFAADCRVKAVFGSYDTNPRAHNFISQYKNLFHHYVHQTSHEHASTFWSGCGAVRRDEFFELGGFDASFKKPTVEDIDLGLRLRAAGHRIVLNKKAQVTHAKRWSLADMVKSDICDRAIPWTLLILRSKSLPNDLNLTWSQRISAGLACGLIATLALGALHHPWLLAIPFLALGIIVIIDFWSARERIPTVIRWTAFVAMVAVLGTSALLLHEFALICLVLAAGIVSLNAGFYAFYFHKRSWLFATAIFPLHLLYFFYSVATFIFVTGWYLVGQFAAVVLKPALRLREADATNQRKESA